MIWPDQWNAPNWWLVVVIILLIGLLATLYSYRQRLTSLEVWPIMLVKVVALVLLGMILLEPKVVQERAVPGANSLVVMVDRSESLQLSDKGSTTPRSEAIKSALTNDEWLLKLENDFQVRKYYVDQKLAATTDFSDFQADRQGSQLLTHLQQAAQRPSGKPLAGIVLLTDGNATDAAETARWAQQQNIPPPIYPVLVGTQYPPRDLAIKEVVCSQSNFEAAPVTVQVKLQATGFSDHGVSVTLKSKSGTILDQQEISGIQDGKFFNVQLRTTEKVPGVSAYQVSARAIQPTLLSSESTDVAPEATMANNDRWVVVDRGRSPLRVLYVSGRPNWELKYLRRAVFDDEELDLVALVRIAKREAKFDFRGRDQQDSNALFRGFENQDDDTAERFDEPVFVRFGTKDADDLRSGFPKTSTEMFQYDAVILDDVEAAFFTQQQQTILQEFASVRGGGVLMLGGQESFSAGQYEKTSIGEMLPVYLNSVAQPPTSVYRLALTREGWLQPWIRLAPTEDQEKVRLREMPEFKILNPVRSIKPGATVLIEAKNDQGQSFPALVSQPFGRGRTAAWMIGDLWRWQLRSAVENDDLLVYWRQTMRWLVSNVPGRCELSQSASPENPSVRQLKVALLDTDFVPLDNADVSLKITSPDGKALTLTAKPSMETTGQYLANYFADQPGAYSVAATATVPGNSEVLTSETAWVEEPSIEEFRNLTPNIELMEQVAEMTGGEVFELGDLNSLVDSLPNRKVPIRETFTQHWWHQWPLFMISLLLLVGEWGLRRWKGMA